MSTKIGSDQAREMFMRGLVELQAASTFQEVHVAQSTQHHLYGDRQQAVEGQPPPVPQQEPGHEFDR